MSDSRFVQTVVEISRILGISDRSIRRWAVNGKIVKQDKGKYCLVSVFKYYRGFLLEQIANLQQKIELASSSAVKPSLQQEKIRQSIKIITYNAQLKEHELKVLQDNLVNRAEAERVYDDGCSQCRELALKLPEELASSLAATEDPNAIEHLLEVRINQLLTQMSLDNTCI